MLKRIGILGGLTPESTVTYYQHIVHAWQQRHHDHRYPEIVIYSVSFQQFENWMEAGDWDAIGDALADGIGRLAAAGADFAVMATNTMHLLFDRLQAGSPIPLLSIVDATAASIREAGLATVGLLGTRFTMEEPFYAEGLRRHGIATLVPTEAERLDIHRVIMDELSMGRLRDASRARYLEIIAALTARGAQGIVLGCTEIPLLVTPAHTPAPLFDTAVLHAEAALAFSQAPSGS
ncbi:MAG TPA: aspartate/glutamate racemase family protein [Vicinamibacterales bacterium]|nr:aspartate/glutamate racemase family protein [Vicinamibacterales bacterium]